MLFKKKKREFPICIHCKKEIRNAVRPKQKYHRECQRIVNKKKAKEKRDGKKV